MLILEIAAGIVLGAFILALVPVVLELLAGGWRLFWEFVEDALELLFFTIPRAIWRHGRWEQANARKPQRTLPRTLGAMLGGFAASLKKTLIKKAAK